MDDILHNARQAQQQLDAKRRTKRMYRQASRIAEQSANGGRGVMAVRVRPGRASGLMW